jgi:hypothetical protein
MFQKKSLFGDTVSPSCAYCAHSRRAESEQELYYCSKKGVVAPTSQCRHFQYDPLRRVPKRRPQMPSFSPEDFAL